MERLLYLVERFPLDFVSYLSSSLPIVIGVYRHASHSPVPRYIWFLFLFFFLKDSYSLWYVYHAISNVTVQNLETLFEVGFLSLIYYYCFRRSVSQRIVLYSGIVSGGIIALTYSYERISAVSQLVLRVYSIGLSLAYFNKILVDLRVKNILYHTMFWFSAGLLVYATGTFFVSLFSEFIFDPKLIDDASFDRYWNLSNITFTVFALLSAVGLWFSRQDRENLA